MLANETLNLALSIFQSLTSGTFEGWRELVQDGKNEFFIDGMLYSGKALLVENDKGSLELLRIATHIRTTIDFNAPCYVIASNGELFNIKQKQGFEPKVSKIKDSLKADFAKAANLDDRLVECLTNTKPIPKLEFVKVSKGYDLEDLPHSCQKGKGYRFEALDNMAQMALLKMGSRIAARCIVWNNNVVFDVIEGKYLKERYADRLYYGDSDDKDLFIKALTAEGIELLWGELNHRLEPETGDYYIQIDDTSAISWLDTFNLMKGDRLYSYDWVNGGYSDDTLNDLVPKYGFTRAFLSVDEEGGMELEDLSNKVYSEYLGEYIDRDNAVYSNSQGDWLPEEDAVYSYFQDDWLLANYAYYSTIEDDYIDESTYEHNKRIASVINRGEEWVKTDNKDYVPYKGDEYRRIALNEACYIDRDDEYVAIDEACYIDALNEYVRTDWSSDEFKDYLADCLGSYSKQGGAL